MSTGVTHIVGVHVRVGNLLRQRCGWCGAILLNYDLAAIAVPVGQDPCPATWPIGELVRVDDGMTFVIQHEDGATLPDDACGKLDPEVTA